MNLQNQINYLRDFLQQDMFDDCSVPDGLDMQRVRGAIVMRCGLLTPLFLEPEVQRMATQQFFFENQWNFEHVLKIIRAEYSPIENVAEWRDEKQTGENIHTQKRERGETEQHSGKDERDIKESGSTTDREGGTTKNAESGTTTETNEISAENVSTYQSDNKQTVQHGKIDTTTHGKTDTTEHGKIVDDDFTYGEKVQRNGNETITDKDSGDRGLSMHRHGNVGVTTNQDMINQELELLERFNPYRFIAELYEKELIIGLF